MFSKEKKDLNFFQIFIYILLMPIILFVLVIRLIVKINKKKNEKFTNEFKTWEKLVYGNNAKKFKVKEERYKEYISRQIDCTPIEKD